MEELCSKIGRLEECFASASVGDALRCVYVSSVEERCNGEERRG